MQASLVRITDPFRPHVGRQVHRISRRTRVDTLLRRHGLIAGRGRKIRRLSNFVVSNGPDSFLLQDEWSRSVKDGQVITIIAVPAGGGILRTLALVVVTVAAAWVSGGAGGAITSGFWASAAGAGVAIAGTMLVNALLPLPKAATGSSSNSSTNYGIGSSGNQAKLGDVIPVLYGKFKVTPNYAAQPYTEYDSDYQYLYSLYCITQGEMEVEAIKIGDTLIDNYAEVKYEVIQPGGVVTLFPTNVYTSSDVSGIELKKPSDQGEGDTPWSGPYAANEPGTKISQIIIDTGYPQGLYSINKSGKYRTMDSLWTFQAQAIDDNGNATGDWITLISANEVLNDTKAGIYTTRRFTVDVGRYQVRMQRLDPTTDHASMVDSFYWMGLRSILIEDAPKYGNVTMLAVQIKATNNINSSTSNQVTVTGTRKLPIWNGSTWSAPTATSSIAWAAADILRNTTYGRGWSDDRMNLAALLALDATWTSRGDYFNGIFDTKTTLWDALTSVLRCGRAIPIYYAGVVEFVRDQPQTVPTLVLTPDNIISFEVDYNFPTVDTPDYVQVTYTDPTTYTDVTVDCALTGSEKNTASAVTLMGCIDRNQAYREGMYMAADNRDRRHGATAVVEMEGYIPQYGDLALVSHDVPAWGLSGQIVSYDEASQTLTLSEPPQWWEGQNVYILLRSRNGGAQGPYRVTAGTGDFEVVLQGLTDAQKDALYVSDGISEDRTIYQLGPGENYAKKFLITKAEPGENGQVTLTLITYSTTPYTAENDADVPPPPSGSLLVNQPTAPAVGGVGISEDSSDQTVTLSVDPVAGAVAYEFQVSYDGGLTWISVGVSTSNSITTSIPAGTWIVRARAISALGISGEWSQTSVTVTGALPVLGALTNLTATGGMMSILLTWQMPSALQLISAQAVEIWFGPTSQRNNAQLLASLSIGTNTYTMTGLQAGATYYFWARILGSDIGNYSPEIGPVTGQSSSDATSILSYLSEQISETQLAKDLLTKIDDAVDATEKFDDYLNAPAYSATAAYSKGTIISDGGHYYRAISNVPAGKEPPNTTYWQDVGTTDQTAYGVAANIYDVNLQVSALSDEMSATATKTDGIYVQVNPQGAGDSTWGAGDTSIYAGTITVQSVAASDTLAVSQRVDTVAASLADAQAQIQIETTARVSADEAQAAQITTLQASLNDATASVQTNAEAITNINDTLSASYNIKVQIAENGQYYAAGIAVGVGDDGTTISSQVLVNAATFAVFDASSGTSVGIAPFIITGGQTIINNAIIGDGTITNAKIGNYIQSDNYDGTNGWKIDKSGTAYFGGDVTIRGNVTAASITGNYQRTVTATWTGSITGSDNTSATDAVALPAPYRSGESHTPIVQVMLGMKNTDDNSKANADLVLQRSVDGGSTWTTAKKRFYTLPSSVSETQYFQFVDVTTSGAVSYRFMTAPPDEGEHSDAFVLNEVQMMILGLK